MPPDYVAKRAVSLLGSGPTGGVMGVGASPPSAAGVARLRRRRHGRHELRHLPRARRPARDQDRLELALPLLHRPADGRRAVRRRRRRLDRPGAPGRAARRARSRPGRRPGPSATAAAATRPTVTDADAVLGYLPVDGFAGGRMTPRRRRGRAPRSRATSPSRSASTSIEAAWGIERIVNANMANATRRVLAVATAPTRATSRSSPTAATAPVHAWAHRRRARRRPRPRAEGGAGVLRARPARRRLRRRPRCARTSCRSRQVDLGRLRGADGRAARRGRQGARAGRPRPTARVDTELFVQMAYAGPELRHERARAPRARRSTRPACSTSPSASTTCTRPTAGFAFRNQQPLVRGVRLIARGETPKPGHLAELGTVTDAGAARTGTRPVYWGDRVRRHAGVRRHACSAPARRSTGPRSSRSRSPSSPSPPGLAARRSTTTAHYELDR